MSNTLSPKEIIEKCKLEYGRTIQEAKFEIAEKKAFTIKIEDCEITYINKSEKNKIEKIKEKTWINSFFADDKDFKIKKSNNTAYNIHEYCKVSLKFKLTPTSEFFEAAKKAINSKKFEDFKDFTKTFGQFISTEVTLGGRAYFKKSNRNNYSDIKLLVGGNSKDFDENFDENKWAESLKDFRNWDCIKFKNLISIFQLLPDIKHIKQDLESAGEEIPCEDSEKYITWYPEFDKRHTEIKIPKDVIKYLREAKHSIFVTVIDRDDKDTFNCEIIWPSDEDPELRIQDIQDPFKMRQCKLEVRWMVQLKSQSDNLQKQHRDLDSSFNDYDSGIPVLSNLSSSNDSLTIGHHFFNDQKKKRNGIYTFSYCLKEEHTLHTLIITNHPNSEILPIKRRDKIIRIINKSNLKSIKPKYIHLYSTEKSEISENQNSLQA